MNFAEYPALAARTEKLLPTDFLRLEHAALGVLTETGEIGTIVKRIAIYGKSLDSIMDKGEDKGKTYRQLIGEEIGDVLWYLPIIGSVQGNQEAFTHTTLQLDAAYGFDTPLLPALTSIVRRLQIHSGRLASYVESMYCDMPPLIDPTIEARSIVRHLVDLAYLAGLDIVQLAADNIAKLQLRYPEKYTDLAAEARADKA
jgi:hypothetical protein